MCVTVTQFDRCAVQTSAKHWQGVKQLKMFVTVTQLDMYVQNFILYILFHYEIMYLPQWQNTEVV